MDPMTDMLSLDQLQSGEYKVQWRLFHESYMEPKIFLAGSIDDWSLTPMYRAYKIGYVSIVRLAC